MAVMIKTLAQLPKVEEYGTLNATKDWQEIARYQYDPNRDEKYWSSHKTGLSAEILYTIYSGTEEDHAYGISDVDTSLNEISVGTKFSGGVFPGVLKTLELRNKLTRDIDITSMRDQLCAMAGSDHPQIYNNNLHLSGHVTARIPTTFRILNRDTANIEPGTFNGVFGDVVPNARAVFNFTRDGLPILFSPTSDFKTRYVSDENKTGQLFSGQENMIRKETVPHDAYLFKIQNSGTVSNIWTTPYAGWFTCFGWLSEIAAGQSANYQRWVVLEGNINGKTDSSGDPNWCILQLQPFNASVHISYVGFGVPVTAGLQLRVRTGFAVGSSSGNYAMSNTGTRSSMANHVANAFVGGIYSLP